MTMHSVFVIIAFFFLGALWKCTFVSADLLISKTLVVDQRGSGDFRSVQAAIQAVPLGNDQWVKIHVKSGVYRERVVIPREKGFIFLEGEGADKTSIESGGHIEGSTNPLAMGLDGAGDGITLQDTATFSSDADDVVVKGIAFKNIYSGPARQALAAHIFGNRSSFYYCSFVGFQDTLADMGGRHYFNGCYIEGAVDFIFGLGQSIYQNCKINVVEGLYSHGWITAQGRASLTDSNGFVFKYCTVTGTGKAMLGRAWGSYSRVVFFRTFMSDIVVSEGWDPWSKKGGEKNLVYAEIDCFGPGSNTSGRVLWEKKLSARELDMYTSLSYIDGDGWLSKQPR